MKQKLLLLTFLFCGITSLFSQVQTNKVTGGGTWYLEYLPADYNLNSNDYPIVFFFHGMGERGNNEADLSRVKGLGPPKMVENGTDFPFIMISGQLKTSWSDWYSSIINELVQHVKTTGLRIDLDRLYVTGLSLGGGGVWFYTAAFPEEVAAATPICGSNNEQGRACDIAAWNIPIWAFHGDADGVVPLGKTTGMINAINACSPAPDPLALVTIYPGVGHNAWDNAYRNDNSLHTPNIYEWMLAQSRTGQAPSADAGADQLIALPTNSVNLPGTGSSPVTITDYLWEIETGPAATLTNATTSTVSVSNMVAGVYNFKFTVTDSDANSAFDNVIVTVNASNTAPTANAGPDVTIKLPITSVFLTGVGSDVDGTVTSYAWSQIGGPAATLGPLNTANLSASNMVLGTYTFRLTVTDNNGASTSDDIIVTVSDADNVVPVANAGPDRSLNLPTNSINITGTGTDTDGTIVTYLWQKASGNDVSMANSSSPTFTASGLVAGTYVFNLMVTDNEGGSHSDNMTLTVSAGNQTPTANAGPDQSITQPTSSTNLSGSGSDPDGSISTYLWTNVSGPATPTIANSNQSACTVNGLSAAGNYIFRLTVTDNGGATASDDIQVTINSAPVNVPPVVNAGADKNITLPTSSTVLSGSATDSDGTVTTYAWTKITGGAATLTGASTATLNLAGLVAGSYTFRLTATDDDGDSSSDDVVVIVNPAAVNESPTASAGADQVVTIPVANVVFVGSGNDNDGTISAYAWVKLSGPSVTLSGTASATLTLTNLVAGSYSFELTVTDDDGAIGSDIVLLTVNNQNTPPVANAGTNKTITLPTNSLTIVGTATDADGSIQTITWTQQSGPSVANFSGANTLNFFVTNLINGLYTFRLTVVDNDGASHFDDVNVTVNAAANNSPTANAGTDKSINLPTNSINLTGSASDSDGTIASILWSQVSGPSSVVFSNETTLTVSITSMVEGIYVFRITATDDDGAIDFDDVSVTVIPEVTNSLPTANAGANQTINLPTNSTTLNGSGSDSDGTVVSYTWIKSAGPSATLVNASSATLTVNDLVEGNYTFRLTVTDDDGGQGSDEVSVSVLPAAVNEPPIANAGADIQLVLPSDATNVLGSGSDPDGTVDTYSWIKLSGGTATLTNVDNPTLSLTNLIEGSYTFELTVTDNEGATGSDEVVVTVLPEAANVGPTANAGVDQTITLPTNSLTITGAGSDTDGAVVGYTWTKVSGGTATLTNANSAILTVNDLVEGAYVFRLEVEDDDGATDQDDMALQVFPETVNMAPVVDAGPDITIVLPQASLDLDANASDPDGNLVSTVWTKVSGGNAVINSPNSAFTNVTGLQQGSYVFRMTATDDDGATKFDEVTVTVLPQGTNVAPTAFAGSDQSIELPTNTLVLDGQSADSDGTIVSMLWTKISGPSATLAGETTATLSLSDLLEGTYSFRFSVTDDDGAMDEDDVDVTVFASGFNQTPDADAGSDVTIFLPASDATLTGVATDDGTIVSQLWTVISGPSAPTMAGEDTNTLTLSNLVLGTYVFQFTITDDGGLSDSDLVKVTVAEDPSNNVSNIPPTVDAGADLTVTENSVTITAFGNDPDGPIRDFLWSQVSGPSGPIVSQGIEGVVTLSNLTVGVYIFKVTVSDFLDATGSDEIQITVVQGIDIIEPSLMFSPNGDGINDFWQIENSDDIAGCNLIIFDRKGSIVYESVGYNGDWNGTRNGSPLPEGVYYYVIRCGDEKNDKTGSITILR